MDKNCNKDEPPLIDFLKDIRPKFEEKKNEKICPRKVALVSTSVLLGLSGFSFLVGGILWFIEGFAFDWIGAGAVGFGCYLIISAFRKIR